MTEDPRVPTGRRLGAALALLLVGLLAPGLALAQSGKISGQVTEAATGEPIPGVNVLVEGTLTGAVTDVDGYYSILRAPVGRVALVFSSVGYARLRVQDVDVDVDRTTTIDARMEIEDAAGEEVVVTAERPPVTRDLTGTATGYRAEEIQRAPVEGVRGVLRLTAGIDTNPDGTLSVRGSGPYDMQVLVNGAPQTMTSSGVPGYNIEKANNSWKYDFNPLGVEALEVISGGFSAEYGNAQSGIVKVSTREGRTYAEGEYRVEVRAPGQYHWGDNLYGEDTPEWDAYGTADGWAALYPDSSAAWRENQRQLWIAVHVPEYTAPVDVIGENGQVRYAAGETYRNPLGVYDYTKLAYVRHLFGVGAPLSRRPEVLRVHLSGEVRDAPTRLPTIERVQQYRNVTLTTTFQPSGRHKLRLTNLHQYYLGGIQSGADDIRYAGREASWKYTLIADSKREEVTNSQTLNYVYTISPKSLLDVTLAHAYETYRVPMVPVPSNRDIIATPAAGYRAIFSLTSLYNQDARTRTFSGNANYTALVSRVWEAKVGGSFQRWSTRSNAVSSFAPNAHIARSGYGDFYVATPMLAAAYWQNKLEMRGMVANLGVRVDGYNFGADVPVDLYAPFYPAEQAAGRGTPGYTRSKTYVRVSPRVGLSFPISDQTAFRLQYGHFSAMPQSRVALTRINELGWNTYGNPNLKPERTIAFETGVQQALWGTHRLDVVGYYNDRASQVSGVRILAESGTTRNQTTYATYVNNGYSATYGAELTFERMEPGRWNYRFSYGLSRTTAGRYGPAIVYSDDPADPRNTSPANRDRFGDPVSGNDRTHRLRSLLTYAIPRGEGLRIGRMRPFEATSISMSYSAQSGTPFTYVTEFEQIRDVVNNRRYPFEEMVDLNVQKAFTLGGAALTAGVRVQNLFNHQHLTPINGQNLPTWINTGEPFSGYSTANVNQQAYTIYRNVPRQVFFSLGARLQ